MKKQDAILLGAIVAIGLSGLMYAVLAPQTKEAKPVDVQANAVPRIAPAPVPDSAIAANPISVPPLQTPAIAEPQPTPAAPPQAPTTLFPALPSGAALSTSPISTEFSPPLATGAKSISKRAFAEAISIASALKVGMAEALQSEGKWPVSNKAIGMGAPESYASSNVSAIQVLPGGRLRIIFNVAGGADLFLIGQETSGGARFKCISPNISDIAKISEDCSVGMP